MDRCRATAARRWRAAVADGDGGYNPLEAAIIIPIIIVFTMLIVQFALVWHGRHVAEAAAQAAARSAAAYTSTAVVGQADGAGYLTQVAPHLLTNRTVTVDRGPQSVTVTVTASVASVLPFGTFTVTQTATAPVEVFVNATR